MRATISLMLLALALPASAVMDPDPDRIGVYFDSAAEDNCLEVGPYTPIDAYVIVTRPTAPIEGVEFRIGLFEVGGSGATAIPVSMDLPGVCPPPIDLSIRDPWNDGFLIFCSSPVPVVDDATVVMVAHYLLLGAGGFDFYLGPPDIESVSDGLPGYFTTGGAYRPLGVSSGDVDLPVASINGCRAVSTEPSTFGALKALYR